MCLARCEPGPDSSNLPMTLATVEFTGRPRCAPMPTLALRR